jgi:hypothetical protein
MKKLTWWSSHLNMSCVLNAKIITTYLVCKW